jgi:hypothetical protein
VPTETPELRAKSRIVIDEFIYTSAVNPFTMQAIHKRSANIGQRGVPRTVGQIGAPAPASMQSWNDRRSFSQRSPDRRAGGLP